MSASDESRALPGDDPHEVMLVARGIATAVAPDTGLSDVQANLLGAIAEALTGVAIDYRDLEPLSAADLADVIGGRDLDYRQRIVHHMVLGELVLRPLPVTVAHRVAQYAEALGVKDDFVRVARRYAQGANGLAWMDLQRSGFVEHIDSDGAAPKRAVQGPPLAPAEPDPELAARWEAFAELPEGSLGRCVFQMYDERGFGLPGTPGGAPPYLAQHDFVHVLADYGTNLKGEIEVFALIGRADPDPKGFAWLATLIGLFETGFVADAGFFTRDVREHNVAASGMHTRLADAIRRGKSLSAHERRDLFEIDFHALAPRPVEDVREILHFEGKSPAAIAAGSPGAFDLEGMSEKQRLVVAERRSLSSES
ncbi:MAG TPA: hypothetical protein VFR41_15785 [Acidimicrobiia bacterium]|nr:hypothetical protein [Acidimicrobiia bacterium]